MVMTMTTEELLQEGGTWKQAHLSPVLSKRNTVESPSMPKYDLQGVKSKMWITQKVVILPFVTIMVEGAAKLMVHSKHVNVSNQLRAIWTMWLWPDPMV